MGSILIVGMLMQITGVPFGKDGFARLVAPQAGVAGPGPVAAPALAVPPAPVAAAFQPPAPAKSPDVAADQHTSHASVASTETKGGQLLQQRLEGDVKVVDLDAKPIQWEVVPGAFVEAWAYNGQVPGPLIRVTEGDKLRVNLKN